MKLRALYILQFAVISGALIGGAHAGPESKPSRSLELWQVQREAEEQEKDSVVAKSSETLKAFDEALVPVQPESGYARGFFDKGKAGSPFQDSLRWSEKQPIAILRPQLAEAEEQTEEAPTESQQPEIAPKAEERKTIYDLSKEEFRSSLVSKYGTPDEKPVVKPSDDAPDSFKAMQEALLYGDVEVAGAYAKRFVEHQRLQEATTKEIITVIQKLSSSTGTFGTTGAEPDYEDVYALIDQAKSDVKAADSGRGQMGENLKADSEIRVGRVDASTAQLIRHGESMEPRLRDKFGEEDEDSTTDPLAVLFESEDKLRAKARELVRTVPVDEAGEARVYYFFRKDDPEAFAMFPVLERVFQERKADLRFHMVGFTLDASTASQAKAVQTRSKISFPVRSGSRLARQLGVAESGSLVFMAPSSGSFIVQEGLAGFGYVDELVKMVQAGGGKR